MVLISLKEILLFFFFFVVGGGGGGGQNIFRNVRF